MRNRCIELSLLPDDLGQPSEEEPSSEDINQQALTPADSPLHNDLDASLAAEGVPGAALPRAMIEAHLSVARCAAAVHE